MEIVNGNEVLFGLGSILSFISIFLLFILGSVENHYLKNFFSEKLRNKIGPPTETQSYSVPKEVNTSLEQDCATFLVVMIVFMFFVGVIGHFLGYIIGIIAGGISGYLLGKELGENIVRKDLICDPEISEKEVEAIKELKVLPNQLGKIVGGASLAIVLVFTGYFASISTGLSFLFFLCMLVASLVSLLLANLLKLQVLKFFLS